MVFKFSLFEYNFKFINYSGVARGTKRKDLISGGNVQIFANGSLLLLNINSADEGHYFCQASNGIGSGLSAAVQVRINGNAFNWIFILFVLNVFLLVHGYLLAIFNRQNAFFI